MRELRQLCKAHTPAIVFLMETRASVERVENVRRKLKFSNMFCVDAIGRSGGLCLLWSDEVNIQIFNSSQNIIHTSVIIMKTKVSFDCSFIYGNPTFQQRRGLWSRLLDCQGDHNEAWCCLGDFNEVLSQHEKDGLRPYHARRADLFRDFLDISSLLDLDLKGCGFTWFSNPRNGFVTKEKLD